MSDIRYNGAPTAPERDYTRPEDVLGAIDRLVAGLKEDGDDPRMFELLGSLLRQAPEAVMPVIAGSIELAARQLGQNRQSGSSATLLYPVDAAMRVVALRRGLFDNPLSADSWDAQKAQAVLEQYGSQIVELAGANTTSKNLPQRAAHLLWLLDRCSLVQPGQRLAFLEIGASGGLILDALQQPRRFQEWMQIKATVLTSPLKARPLNLTPCWAWIWCGLSRIGCGQ